MYNVVNKNKGVKLGFFLVFGMETLKMDSVLSNYSYVFVRVLL